MLSENRYPTNILHIDNKNKGNTIKIPGSCKLLKYTLGKLGLLKKTQ